MLAGFFVFWLAMVLDTLEKMISKPNKEADSNGIPDEENKSEESIQQEDTKCPSTCCTCCDDLNCCRTIKRFANKLSEYFLRYFSGVWDLMNSIAVVKCKDDRKDWRKKKNDSLPNYFVACGIVYADMYEYLTHEDVKDVKNTVLKKIISGLCIFLTFTGIGILVSTKGRIFGYIVIKKYTIFFLACLGVWSDEVIECYDLETLKKEHYKVKLNAIAEAERKLLEEIEDMRKKIKEAVTNNSLDSLHQKLEDRDSQLTKLKKSQQEIVQKLEMLKEEEEALDADEPKSTLSWFDTINPKKCAMKWGKKDPERSNDDHEEMPDLIALTISPRAILLQVLPLCSFLSIFAIICSSTPIWFGDKWKAKQYFPPFFIKDVKTLMEEKEELEEEWVRWIKSWKVYITLSRSFCIVHNFFVYSMTIGILYSDPYIWMILSFYFLIPQIGASALEVFVITGHKFNIKDKDFPRWVGLSSDVGDAEIELS